jgi:hypothetical protein
MDEEEDLEKLSKKRKRVTQTNDARSAVVAMDSPCRAQ